MTIREVLEAKAREIPEKVYFYFEDITQTYAEMDRIANRVANGLTGLECGAGRRSAC